ncbi:MAG: Trk system potassium transporter TrkA [Eubacteriaceae bacterium]|nr:Trk system potassium transporter TrkA [Eubacteriaceae bacterium]
MNIIIVGCGNVGYAIARSLSAEKIYDVTVIDSDSDSFEHAVETTDAIFINGNGFSESTLIEAGARDAHLLISVTGSDETNILCCICAKHLGTKNTIARVSGTELGGMWKDLGIDAIINPELQTALEISRQLRYPTAANVDTLLGGRVELITYKVADAPGFFVGKSPSQFFGEYDADILIAAVERDGKAIVPNGDFIFQDGDLLRILGRPSSISNFFFILGKKPERIKDTMIIGGGRTTYWLADLLSRQAPKTRVKIIEKDKTRCESLAEKLSIKTSMCLVVHGDGANEETLLSEDIEQAGCVICLTDEDEHNVLISLYSQRAGIKKVITEVNYVNQKLVRELGLKNIVCPLSITTEFIMRYIKSLTGNEGNNERAMANEIYDGADGSIQAIEFKVTAKARCLGTPIKGLKLRNSLLIGCIIRDESIFIPAGDTSLQMGDTVIIISKESKIHHLDDILANRLPSIFSGSL